MASYSSVSLKKSLSLIPAFAWRTRPKSVELIAKGIKMKPFLFALLTGLGFFCFEVSKAQAQTVRRPQNCGPREAMVARLAKAYGEVRKSRAWEPITPLLRCLHSTKPGLGQSRLQCLAGWRVSWQADKRSKLWPRLSHCSGMRSKTGCHAA